MAVADWLKVDPLLIRTLFVLTTLASGLGLFIYGAGWALTPDARTGVAPLDKLGTGWRDRTPSTVTGWAIALSAMGALSFSSVTSVSWLGLGVVAGTIWLGWRARHYPGRHLHPPPAPPLLPQSAPGEPRKPRRSTVPLALITLSIAFLAGMTAYETFPTQPWVGLTLALFIMGLGMVLAASRGFSVLLLIAGLLTSLALGLGLVSGPIVEPEQLFHYSEQSDLRDLNIDQLSARMDLMDVEVATNQTWRLNVTSSNLSLDLPPDQNVDVIIVSVDSLVGTPNGVQIGQSPVNYSSFPQPGAPNLTILLYLDSSEVWVG